MQLVWLNSQQRICRHIALISELIVDIFVKAVVLNMLIPQTFSTPTSYSKLGYQESLKSVKNIFFFKEAMQKPSQHANKTTWATLI